MLIIVVGTITGTRSVVLAAVITVIVLRLIYVNKNKIACYFTFAQRDIIFSH